MGSHAGAFTADAELTANFSATAADATISGELTGFRSGDQTMDWTVAFEETAIASGAFSDTTNGTEWTIGDTAAANLVVGKVTFTILIQQPVFRVQQLEHSPQSTTVLVTWSEPSEPDLED